MQRAAHHKLARAIKLAARQSTLPRTVLLPSRRISEMSGAQATHAQKVLAARQERLEQNAALSALAKGQAASASKAVKRPADPSVEPQQPAKAKRSSAYPHVESKVKKEAELVDLEKDMEPYDWEKPNFPLPNSAPRIVYIKSNSDAQLKPALDELLKRPSDVPETDPIVLGFDMEWKVSFTRYSGATGMVEGRTALIQICSRSLVVILHISQMVPFPQGSDLPPLPAALETLLTRSDVYKTGVRIEGDAIKLQKEFRQACGVVAGSPVKGVRSAALLELSRLAQEVDPDLWADRGRRLISLRELTAVYLGRKLAKDATRTSDWSQRTLSPEQLKYAASDVMSGLEIYEALRRRAVAKEEDSLDQLPALPKRRDYDVIKDEQTKELKKEWQDAIDRTRAKQQAASSSSASKGQAAESQESGVSMSGSSVYTDAASAPESQLMEDQLDESQMSIIADPPLAGESQLESQMSLATNASSSSQFSFRTALMLSSSDLPEDMGLRKASGEGPNKGTTAAPPKPLLAHQRTFDLWMLNDEGTPLTFKDIAVRNKVQPNTAAGYVLKAFGEDRHAADDDPKKGTGDVAVPGALKKRLAAELGDPELRGTMFRYADWLKKHDVMEVPEREPKPEARA